MRRLVLAALLASSAALAETPSPAPEPPQRAAPPVEPPEIATLAQLLQAAQQREGLALYRAIVAERRAAAAEAALKP